MTVYNILYHVCIKMLSYSHLCVSEGPYILSRKCQYVQKILFTLSRLFNLQEQTPYVQAEHANVDICINTCSVYQGVQMSVV